MGRFNTYNPYTAKKIRKVIEITNLILDTLSTEYIQQAFTHASRIFHFRE